MKRSYKWIAIAGLCLLFVGLLTLPLAQRNGGKFDFLGELSSKERVFAMTGSGTRVSPGFPDQAVALDSVMLKGVTPDEAADAIAAALPATEWVRNGTFFECKQPWFAGAPFADTISVVQDGDKVLIQKIRRFKPLERQLLPLEHKLQGL